MLRNYDNGSNDFITSTINKFTCHNFYIVYVHPSSDYSGQKLEFLEIFIITTL